MRFLNTNAALGAAVLLLSAPVLEAKHSHELSHLQFFDSKHAHHRQHHHHQHERPHASPKAESVEDSAEKPLEKRQTQCQFPTGAGLVAVTPNSLNAGWAMSPDQQCTPNHYCPYACPSGQLAMQWDPSATSYSYPESMNGGLYCDSTGAISKPFPNQPYCKSGTGSVGAQNNCGGGSIAICQTVLPGNEAMLIPTVVNGWAELAVPGTDYWCSTAAHYYINPPGTPASIGCTWGDGSSPIGNWSPYVAGANTDANGNTFVKAAWNPIFTGDPTLSATLPTFGIEIICNGNGCNGLPCKIDPSVNGLNGVTSSDQSSGAGGANFCVVTVPKGVTADIVVFDAGQSGNVGTSKSKSASSSSSPSTSASPSPTPSPSPSPSPTPSPSSSSSSSSSSKSSSPSSSTVPSTSSSSSSSSSSTSSEAVISPEPHIFYENTTAVFNSSTTLASSTIANSTRVPTVTSPTAAATSSSAAEVMNAVLSPGFLGVSALVAFACNLML